MEKKERRDELYKVALEVFSEYGYKKTTVEDIASRMSLTKGAIYQYVNSKETLYYEAVRQALLDWQQVVYGSIKKETDITQKFYVLCKRAFSYLDEDRILKKILINDPSIFPMSFKDDPYKDINDHSMGYIKRILNEGISKDIFKPMVVDTVARLLYIMYKMLIIEKYVEEQESENILETTINLVTFGLLK